MIARAGKTEKDEKEKMREKTGRPNAGGVRQRVGQDAAGKASAGLKIEGANDVQPTAARREPC